jgi:outer membrane protein OmpA-like peptidoglycan-associated protein
MLKKLFLSLLVITAGCYPTPGPDKSLAGAVLGAGWGAGAGAIVGNQFGTPDKGAAIGAGLGAGSGLMQGIALDVAEGAELAQQRELDALKVQVASNQRSLESIQDTLDRGGRPLKPEPSQIFFDPSRASLRLGTVTQLERIVQRIKFDSSIREIQVHGHSDDLGRSEENMRLSEARARTVKTFLAEHGIQPFRMQPIDLLRPMPLRLGGS